MKAKSPKPSPPTQSQLDFDAYQNLSAHVDMAVVHFRRRDYTDAINKLKAAIRVIERVQSRPRS